MNSFTIYEEYFELITLLSENEQQELLLAICKYMFKDITPNLNENQQKIFRNLKRPLDISKKRSKSGSKTLTNKNQKEIKKETNQNQKEIKIKSNDITNNTTNDITHQDVYVYVNVNVKNIIDYLNIKSKSNFRYSSEKTKSLIKARINDGYTFEDFKKVIDNKCEEWIGTEFEKFLRPETLFNNKFESYLNQKVSSKKNIPKWIDKDYKENLATEHEIKEFEKMLGAEDENI